MKRKVKGNIKSTTFMYVYMRGVSEQALGYAKNATTYKEQYYNIITSITFSAFCLEAYLSHIGARVIPDWQDIERDLSVWQKRDKLSHQLKVKMKGYPFKHFEKIIRFRNAMAHGKTEQLTNNNYSEMLEDNQQPTMPLAEWQQTCSLEKAILFFNATGEMIDRLHRAAGYSYPSFQLHGMDEWEITTVDDDDTTPASSSPPPPS